MPELIPKVGSGSPGNPFVPEKRMCSRYFDNQKGKWSKELAVSDAQGGNWEPRIAFDKWGNAWIIYDSSRGNEFNLYLARVEPDGKVTEYPIGHSSKYEARASIVATSEGEGFWIAAEQGKEKHGLDYRGHGNDTGINAGKRVLFGKFDLESKRFHEIPMGAAGRAGVPANRPMVGVSKDGNPGRLPLFQLRPAVPLPPFVRKTRLGAPVDAYPQAASDRIAPFPLFPLMERVYPYLLAIRRIHKAHQTAAIILASLPSASHCAGSVAQTITPQNLGNRRILTDSRATCLRTTPMDRRRSDLWTVLGGVHRHTSANCRTGFDGCILDHFRYAYDLAKIDFLGTSDHTDVDPIIPTVVAQSTDARRPAQPRSLQHRLRL